MAIKTNHNIMLEQLLMLGKHGLIKKEQVYDIVQKILACGAMLNQLAYHLLGYILIEDKVHQHVLQEDIQH